MKRDMDLVRDILLSIEASPKARTATPVIDGYNEDTVRYHVELLKDAGYVDQPRTPTVPGGVVLVGGLGLTWSGHEFLATVRDPEIWQQTKAGASKAGAWTVGLIAELGKALLLQKARDAGLPV